MGQDEAPLHPRPDEKVGGWEQRTLDPPEQHDNGERVGGDLQRPWPRVTRCDTDQASQPVSCRDGERKCGPGDIPACGQIFYLNALTTF